MKNSKKTQSSGFTLVEILVVISIIAILAALVTGASMKVMSHAKSSEANAVAKQIVLACESFHGEYGYYPTQDGQEPDYTKDRYFQAAGVKFLGALTGEFKDQNTKGKKYLQIKDASSNGVGGILRYETGNAYSLKDPWGQNYEILIDYNYNGSLQAFSYGEKIKLPVLVRTRGADGIAHTDDDIKSWE